MGAEVAKDKGGGGGARFDVKSGGGRFIDDGLFILPKLDMAQLSFTCDGAAGRVCGDRVCFCAERFPARD